MWQWLVVLCINPANRTTGVQIGYALVVFSTQTGHTPVTFISHRLIMGTPLKIIFSEAMRPLAYILSVLQCLVFPYVNPDQWVQLTK